MKRDLKEIQHKRIPLADAIPLKTPFTVLIDPCGACNFKCVFCPCNQTQYKAGERHQLMSWAVFQRVLDGMKEWAERDLREHPDKELSLKVVDFHGFGEPLLNPLLPDMIHAVKEAHICREIRTVTNGSLLTPELSKKLIDAGLDLCRVSVEAMSSERYRELTGTNITFEAIYENMKSYYELSRGTSSKLSVKIISEAITDSAAEARYYEVFAPISDFCFIEEVGDVWPDYEIKLQASAKHIKGIRKAIDKDEYHKICTYPFVDMLIHSNGVVSPCRQDWAQELNVGDIRVQSLNEIWNGERMKWLQLSLLDRSAYEKTICGICNRVCPDDIDDASEAIRHRLLCQNVF